MTFPKTLLAPAYAAASATPAGAFRGRPSASGAYARSAAVGRGEGPPFELPHFALSPRPTRLPVLTTGRDLQSI